MRFMNYSPNVRVVTHLRAFQGRINRNALCGSKGRIITAEFTNEVTCQRCLKAIRANPVR